MLHKNLWIVATCRKDQIPEIETELDNIFHVFDILEIHPLDDKEDQALKEGSPDRPNKKSDGTPGGYFLPVNSMRRRYNSLPVESLEREIFHVCKALRATRNSGIYSSFSKYRIKDYCHKRLEFYYLSPRIISPFEWDSAFHSLIQKELISDLGNKILIEEIYLDSFVKTDSMSLSEEVLSYYPSTINFSKAINKAPDFERAQDVFQKMQKAGCRPNEVTFNSLLNKAPDFERAQTVFQQMQKAGCRPNEFTFNSLLNKAPDFERAQDVFQQMQKADCRPDEFTFNSLLNKAPDFERAQAVFIQMQNAGCRPNEVTFSSLLNKAPDFEHAQAIFQQMQKAGCRLDEVTFNSLLNKAPDFERAQAIFQQMQKAGCRPDEFTFNSLLNKAPDFECAQDVFQQMQKAGCRPDEFTFNSLLNKAPDFERAQDVFQQMQKAGCKSDEVTFNSLLNKAPDFERAIIVIEKAKKYQIQIERTMLSTLSRISGLSRKNRPDHHYEQIFFNQYFLLLSKQEDTIISFFAEILNQTNLKRQLLECFQEKDWRYWKIKADIHIPSNWQDAFEYLDRALNDVPPKYRAQVLAIWIKNVVFNDLQDLFETAIQYCDEALQLQPKGGDLPYTGKLRLWFIVRLESNSTIARQAIEDVTHRWKFSPRLIDEFLSLTIWEDFPTDELQNWIVQLKP